MSDRTFKVVEGKKMQGKDVKAWQGEVKDLFAGMKIDAPIKADGVYGVATRGFTAALCRAMGLKSAEEAMKNGVTPELRVKLRNKNLTPAERANRDSAERRRYRSDLRSRWGIDVHSPVTKIITDDWGYHPGIHDGVDVVCPENAFIFAMVKAKVIDVRAAGWWGLGAPADPKLKAKGDGIIQIEVLEAGGPFKKGMHIGYGHAEKALVKVDQVVPAGCPLGHAGFANAWHVHLMVNSGGTMKGIGTQDPRPLLDYAVKNG